MTVQYVPVGNNGVAVTTGPGTGQVPTYGAGGNAPNIPTAAQLAKLATLQATATAALVAFNAIAGPNGTLIAAQAAYLDASEALNQYENYIYGGAKPGIYDEGGPSIT